jgi:hypothetical protein
VLPLTAKLRALDDVQSRCRDDDSYWLERCQGFTVHDEDGRFGTVSQANLGRSLGGADSLAARVGLFSRTFVRIPAAQVDHVSRAERRVTLRSPSGGIG